MLLLPFLCVPLSLLCPSVSETAPTRPAPVWSVQFSPDGKLLAAVGDDRAVQIFDAATVTRISSIEGHTDDVLHVAFSPDGKLLATASADRTDCGTSTAGPSVHRSPATPTPSGEWRSALTAGSSPPPAPTAPCGCGTPPADFSAVP